MDKSPVEYVSNFLNGEEQRQCFNILWAELAWERREGAPRREYWTNVMGRDYTYGSGERARTYQSHPTHEIIEQVSSRLKNRLGFKYEGCFLNGYENSRDWLGWHADDDPGINHARPIAVVTLGAGRNIQYRPADPDSVWFEDFPRASQGRGNPYEACAGCGISVPQINYRVNGHAKECPYRAKGLGAQITTQFLDPGSLFLMKAGMQSTHLHKIPKADREVGPRISLTFRSLL